MKLYSAIPTLLILTLVSDPNETLQAQTKKSFTIGLIAKSQGNPVFQAARVGATDAAKEHLAHLITTSRFRPRMSGGQFARTAPIAVRYHLTE